MFEKKTDEQLKAMNSEELHSYYMAKLNHEKEELEKRVKSLEADSSNADLAKEVKELRDTQMSTLKSALKEQGIVLEKLRRNEISGAIINAVEGTIEKSIADKSEDFKKSKDGRHEFGFTVKVAGDMTLAGNVTGTVPQAQRLEGVNDIAERVAITYPMIPKLNTTANTIEWVYETAQDGTITGTAEGASKDKLDNDFIVASVSLVKRAAYFKVSTEMLDDASFMASWLRNKLIVRLMLDIDNQCLNGDGLGQNVNGVINQATAFAAGTFANNVDNANDIDSLVVAINQIQIANQGMNNLTIMVNPSTIANLKLTKLSATDKRYVDRLIMVAGSMSLDGVPLLSNNNITAGDFLVGDFTKALIAQKSDITVNVGLDGNDFTKNMRTILAEWRGQLLIENNDRTAFVKGTFATTNAALETP